MNLKYLKQLWETGKILQFLNENAQLKNLNPFCSPKKLISRHKQDLDPEPDHGSGSETNRKVGSGSEKIHSGSTTLPSPLFTYNLS
jgi:hypothetical protein